MLFQDTLVEPAPASSFCAHVSMNSPMYRQQHQDFYMEVSYLLTVVTETAQIHGVLWSFFPETVDSLITEKSQQLHYIGRSFALPALPPSVCSSSSVGGGRRDQAALFQKGLESSNVRACHGLYERGYRQALCSFYYAFQLSPVQTNSPNFNIDIECSRELQVKPLCGIIHFGQWW